MFVLTFVRRVLGLTVQISHTNTHTHTHTHKIGKILIMNSKIIARLLCEGNTIKFSILSGFLLMKYLEAF